jgi:sigma54-dependent transcription regulator
MSDWRELKSLISLPQIPGLIGNSPALQMVATAIARLAPYKGTVLILGESGTGKELVAEALHRMGPSSSGPLVKFNCSNLVSGLAESQLFGHVRGAFTDARETYDGCFRQANGGTLLLDEVGELPLRMQSKILRAVENLEVQAVGSSETFRLDLRILVATNRDLRTMVARASFAPTFITASIWRQFALRRCASGSRIPAHSPLTLLRTTIESSASRCAGFRLAHWRSCALINGPATCANWRIRSSAQYCSARTIGS